MIRLMKSTFHQEEETKKKLCAFITRTKKLSMGDTCKKFENSFANYQQRKYALLFNSGSSANLALIQSLINLGKLKKGDKIAFSSLTWATNVMPIIQLGLEIIPLDISLKTLNVSPSSLEKALEKHDIKAFFLTNVLGFSDDIIALQSLCKERKIILLEDNCESLGSKVGDTFLGNFGYASTFSFFVGHHLSTIEGGMVCTNDPELHDMLTMTRSHGWGRSLSSDKKKNLENEHSIKPFYSNYTFYTLGYNLRPTEITGFLGMEQLKFIGEMNQKRAENFKRFHEAAQSNEDFKFLDISHMSFVSNFAYPLICEDEEKAKQYQKKFEEANIEIRPLLGGSISLQPFFKKHLTSSQCPNAEKAHSSGFYFPNNPELTDEETQLIISLISK